MAPLSPRPRFLAAAAATAVLLGVSFPSWNLFPVQWVALAVLLESGRRMTPRRAAGWFFAAGWVFHLFLLQWLLANVYWAGGWAVLGYAALSAYLAAWWAAFGWVWVRLNERAPWLPAWLSATVLWTAMEFAQSRLLTGFGWSAQAHAQSVNLPLAQWAAVGGVLLVTAIVVASSALLGHGAAEKRGRWGRLGGAAGLLIAAHAGGTLMLQPADYETAPFEVGLFQSDFDQGMKWDSEYAVEMVRNSAEKTRRLAEGLELDLLVWPEALILDPIDTPPIDRLVAAVPRAADAPLLAGGVRYDPRTGRWYNTAWLVRPGGETAGYYDKVRLAPFGEYMPFRDWLPMLAAAVPVIGEMGAGKETVVFDVNGRAAGPLICFEILFPFMSETLRARGADVLVVITNLGWFGHSNVLDQERAISRFRAIETRLPLVHCANTGHTGVFDPWGRFTAIGPPHQRIAAAVRLPLPAEPPLSGGPVGLRWGVALLAAVFALGAALPAGWGPASEVPVADSSAGRTKEKRQQLLS